MGNPWSTHGRPMDKSRATRELRTSKPWAPHGQPRTSHGGNTGTSRAAHEQPTDSLLWAIRGQPMGNNPRAAHGQPKGNPRVTHSQGTCKFGQPTDSCAWGYSTAVHVRCGMRYYRKNRPVHFAWWVQHLSRRTRVRAPASVYYFIFPFCFSHSYTNASDVPRSLQS